MPLGYGFTEPLGRLAIMAAKKAMRESTYTLTFLSKLSSL